MGKKILLFFAWLFGIGAIALIIIYGLVLAAAQFWFLAIAVGCAVLAVWLAILAMRLKRKEEEHREEKLIEKEEKNREG